MKMNKIGFLELIREEMEKFESLRSKLEVISEKEGAGASKEEDIGEFFKYLPKFEMSEKAGEFGADAQKTFQDLMQNVKGDTLQEKLKSINNFVDGVDLESFTVSEILSSLTFLRLLTKVLEEFGPSPAGFVFEAFLAALLMGKQVTGGSLPIDDIRIGVNPRTGEGGQPLSLKLLKPSTNIEGSLKNLIYFLGNDPQAHKQGVEYIVAVKWKDTYLGFFSFTITGEDFWDWIDSGSFYTSRLKRLDEKKNLVDQAGLKKELEKEMKEMKDLVSDLLEMFGIDYIGGNFESTKDAETFTSHYGIPNPMLGGQTPKTIEKTYNIATSEVGKKAFEKFKKLAKNDIDVSRLEFNDDDDWETIKKKLTARRQALIKVMRTTSTKNPLSIQKMRNYQAFLGRKKKRGKTSGWQNTLANIYKKDPQQWAKILERARSDNQFHIDQRDVRNRGNNMGEVMIGADKIKKAMGLYTEQLKKEVIPIYRNLGLLTENINDFYIGGDVLGGTRAAENAKELARDASNLAKQTKQ